VSVLYLFRAQKLTADILKSGFQEGETSLRYTPIPPQKEKTYRYKHASANMYACKHSRV